MSDFLYWIRTWVYCRRGYHRVRMDEARTFVFCHFCQWQVSSTGVVWS